MKETPPLPPLMKKLPIDSRGYPIPYVVTFDARGHPLFTANDIEKVMRCIKGRLCSICGNRLASRFWFVGGPQSAFHEHGAYADTAMHHECMTYALQVCPYLATRTASRMKEAVVAGMQRRLPEHRLLVDYTQDPTKPPMFVAVMASGQSFSANGDGGTRITIRPLRPYQDVEFWNSGIKLPNEEGVRYVRAHSDLDVAALRLVLKRWGL